MEDFESQKYRKDLAKEIRRESDREKRQEILNNAKPSEEYQEAKKSYKKERNENHGSEVELSIKRIQNIVGFGGKEAQTVSGSFYNELDEEQKRSIVQTANDLEHNKKSLDLGLVFHISTSNGVELVIKSISMINKHTGTRKIILLAFNLQGGLLGQRCINFQPNNEQNVVEGRIDVYKKGLGLAVPIDTVLLDVLKREAFKMRTSIVWNIMDANQINLDKLRHELTISPSDKLLVEIKTKEIEHERWLALYGLGGKFRTELATKSGGSFQKVIHPGDKPYIVGKGDVWLKRDPDSDFAKVTKEEIIEEISVPLSQEVESQEDETGL